MSILDAALIALSFGVLTSIARFVVLAWMPQTRMARFFRKTIS